MRFPHLPSFTFFAEIKFSVGTITEVIVMPLRRFRSGNFLTAIVLIHERHEALGVKCSPWFP
jgi:hypothetical protein